jgi:hypothetical protein
MFPVRCVLVLGSDPAADMQTGLKNITDDVKATVMEGAIRGAAVQMGIQTGLMFAGPVGWAVSSVISLAQHFSGKYYTKKTKDVIEQASLDIKAYAKKKQKYVESRMIQVYDEEFPAAAALALSNQDLGSWFTDLVGKAKKTVKKVVAPVKKVIASPASQSKLLSTIAAPVVSVPRIIIKDALRATQKVVNVTIRDTGISKAVSQAGKATGVTQAAEFVGDKTGISDAAKKSGVVGKGSWVNQPGQAAEKVDEIGTTAQKIATMFVPGMQAIAAGELLRVGSKVGGKAVATGFRATGNEGAAEEAERLSKAGQYAGQTLEYAGTPGGLYNTMSGRETYLYALKAAAEMKAKAFKMIDDVMGDVIKKFTSPAGRETLRVQIAKNIRNDPVALQEAIDRENAARYALANQEAAEAAALAAMEKNAQADTPSTGGAGLLVGISAAAAAAFAFTR